MMGDKEESIQLAICRPSSRPNWRQIAFWLLIFVRVATKQLSFVYFCRVCGYLNGWLRSLYLLNKQFNCLTSSRLLTHECVRGFFLSIPVWRAANFSNESKIVRMENHSLNEVNIKWMNFNWSDLIKTLAFYRLVFRTLQKLLKLCMKFA